MPDKKKICDVCGNKILDHVTKLIEREKDDEMHAHSQTDDIEDFSCPKQETPKNVTSF